ncbi:hypothetical protein [Streptomyces sp. JJ36]|uniref:hypothetical protein n=1 Tax=Streptomyces sp. JJ36 TaxID=2736645 RepID=UPI001F386CFB|nr:hypothetical protein [Streptomyces sp. JJ36]MCF6524164.1 hypothetical protein [Streptomyces sp. JJ36]
MEKAVPPTQPPPEPAQIAAAPEAPVAAEAPKAAETAPGTDVAAAPEAAHAVPETTAGTPETAGTADTAGTAGTPAAPGAPPEAPGPGAPGGTAGRRHPRGRTTLILAAAALLGVVAGVATGYTVQAGRKPTPLAPLSQDALAYPDKPLPADAVEPVPAEHDRRVKTDGDLRDLLVRKPEGAQEVTERIAPDGWMTPYGHSGEGHEFEKILERDLRRIAVTAWEDGDRFVVVRLVQYQQIQERSARAFVDNEHFYLTREGYADYDGRAIEGSADGRYYAFDEPVPPGELGPYRYLARAVASQGDVAMDIWITGSSRISEKEIRKVAERQWGRL